MIKNKKLVIVGDGEFAEIAYEYFTYDSDFEVVAFAVESQYKKRHELFHLPVIEFEKLKAAYPPSEFYTFVAITYTQLNRVRTRLFQECKKLGYICASYVSSNAFVWHNVKIGENTFIFEDNTVQYHVSIGNNVILWSGNHVGHRTVIEDNCWLTSHCVISGFCRIGESSFLGVNATLGDNVTLARDTLLAAGALTVKDLLDKGSVYKGSPAKISSKSSYEQFNVRKEIL